MVEREIWCVHIIDGPVYSRTRTSSQRKSTEPVSSVWWRFCRRGDPESAEELRLRERKSRGEAAEVGDGCGGPTAGDSRESSVPSRLAERHSRELGVAVAGRVWLLGVTVVSGCCCCCCCCCGGGGGGGCCCGVTAEASAVRATSLCGVTAADAVVRLIMGLGGVSCGTPDGALIGVGVNSEAADASAAWLGVSWLADGGMGVAVGDTEGDQLLMGKLMRPTGRKADLRGDGVAPFESGGPSFGNDDEEEEEKNRR